MDADIVWMVALAALVVSAVPIAARSGRMKEPRKEGGRDDHAANAGSWFGSDRGRRDGDGPDGGNGGGNGGGGSGD